ncbi:hypothetical protein JR316_0002248 [Psilocybe cubensis]|uniref:Uncharacterized protein n=1 Tax=Psilocybe cubensis TaxID=181762 RepID=A0ACB8HC82_PSICU|nr:hypothetical protein JR316_0002248 [Psilocybe cubensis]KAH9485340.1 hypothetical protein JR316_0002248 [Psilocybe cubensis]
MPKGPRKGPNSSQFRINGRFAKPSKPTIPSNSEPEVNEITSYLNNLTITKYSNMTAPNNQESASSTEERLTQLLQTVNALASQVQLLSASRTMAQPQANTLPPPEPQHSTGFVLPIPNTLDASPSLRSTFPEIEAAHITAIIIHTFQQYDLHKLDSKYCEKMAEPAYTFNASTMQFEASNKAAHKYKMVNSLLTPLIIYFDVLIAHLFAASPRVNVSHFFFKFINHFHKLTTEYDWPAVLEYTMAFIARQCADMADHGNYTKWGLPNKELQLQHLFGHCCAPGNKTGTLRATGIKKDNGSTVCQNFNLGTCTQTPCPYGRIHAKGSGSDKTN